MIRHRSILSVPGHVVKMHARAAAGAADVVMLDLEDSVPLGEKEGARAQAIRSLRERDWGERALALRINGLDTPFGYRDLIAVAEAAGDRLDHIVVPKADHPRDVHCACRLLDGIEARLTRTRPLKLAAIIESAAGMADIRATAAASPRLCALVFGVADYSTSIGARLISISGHGENEAAIYPGHRWHFGVSRIVMAAKAHGLAAIDAPYGNFRDPAGLESAAAAGCALGMDGKWAIHPDQVEIINRVFSPSAEEIARARRVVAACAEARRTGRGAVAVDGRMVDQATVRLAERMLGQCG